MFLMLHYVQIYENHQGCADREGNESLTEVVIFHTPFQSTSLAEQPCDWYIYLSWWCSGQATLTSANPAVKIGTQLQLVLGN